MFFRKHILLLQCPFLIDFHLGQIYYFYKTFLIRLSTFVYKIFIQVDKFVIILIIIRN